MHIAFDVLPLIGCRMTELAIVKGQIQALSKMYPDDEFLLQFFSRKNEEIKIQRLQPYLRKMCSPTGRKRPAMSIGWCPTFAHILSALLRGQGGSYPLFQLYRSTQGGRKDRGHCP